MARGIGPLGKEFPKSIRWQILFDGGIGGCGGGDDGKGDDDSDDGGGGGR